MGKVIRNIATLIVAAITILGVPSLAFAAYYPNQGDLYYDGYLYADSYLTWSSPGPWSRSDPGYEHDFSFNPKYLGACSTWTDLPYGYDDCPTAGVDEPGTYWTFSFGSFHTNNIIQPGRLDLTRFRGHHNTWGRSPQKGDVHHAEIKPVNAG